MLRGADFNTSTTMDGFFVDSGSWSVTNGALSVAAKSLGKDAASVYYVEEYLPVYYEITAAVQSRKPTAGWKANAYIIFDYFGPTDFKFTGIDISTNKLVMGYRNASGWNVVAQTSKMMKGDTFYNLLVAINGTTATLLVDGTSAFSYTFTPRVVDGQNVALNKGLVGMGSDNAQGVFDDVRVQVLPPQVTYDGTSDLTKGTQQLDQPLTGTWSSSTKGYTGTAATGSQAVAPVLLGGVTRLSSTAWSEVTARLNTTGVAGVAFDLYGTGRLKFVALDVPGQRVILGHLDARGNLLVDSVVARALSAATTYTLMLTLKGASASLLLDGSFITSFGFNAGVGDGRFGLLVRSGSATFTSLRIRTDDPAMSSVTPPAVVPTVSLSSTSVVEGNTGTKSVAVTVSLSQATTVPVSVVVNTIAGGTATAGSDFTFAPVTVGFAAGETSKTVNVQVIGDTAVEGSETVVLGLSSVSGATIGTPSGTLTITNDDAARMTASSIGPGTTSSTLTLRALRRVLRAAVDYWRAQGVPAHRLAGLRVVRRDLAGAALAETTGRTIVLDADAAGWGWSTAALGARGRMHLFTVLVHEIGHVLGHSHTDDGVMEAVLRPGQVLATPLSRRARR